MEWELYAVNVNSGAEKLLAAVNFPPGTGMLAGFSIHPDGNSQCSGWVTRNSERAAGIATDIR